ncbi:MAG TPA: hypothetical protein DET46_06610 [Comamonadaceae bacterium]|nr:MAG: hypothetical protein A3F76_07655 [Burkholderiales bacterium RIFCSPLOWO2_12_FULL_65_40]HCE28469.1 hypothetical protein [Comamonadaceae bacterium]
MGGGLGLVWLGVGKLRPEVIPVIWAEVLKPQQRLKSIQLARQRGTRNTNSAKNLIEILLTDTDLIGQFAAARSREFWKRHGPKSSTQLDFFKPQARFFF